MRQEKSSLLRNKGFQSLLASLLCIVLGLLIGYIVLLIINPAGAGEAIRTIVENFLYYPSAAARLRYLGNTLVKTAPLLMCSLSVLFAYKVGLFNIGAAGQYVIGAGASLYCALGFGLPWYVCLLAAIAAGAVLGAISGLLKAYRNVNEVISCIMLNWISLYLVNALLSQVKETARKMERRILPLLSPTKANSCRIVPGSFDFIASLLSGTKNTRRVLQFQVPCAKI